MAGVRTEIRQALETHLTTVPGIQNIIFENLPTKPPTRDQHVLTLMMYESRIPATRGLNPTYRYEGSLRLELKFPLNTGPSAADDLADAIVDHFVQSDLTKGPVTVRVDEGYALDGGTIDSWYTVPVTIFWYAYQK